MSDNNVSPVGWYVGSYLLRFIELNSEGNYDEDNRFLSWNNTILVRAKDLDEAYKGGDEGVPVQWIYEGITGILPIYDELAHGTEIMFSESTRKLKNLKIMVRAKGQFHQ